MHLICLLLGLEVEISDILSCMLMSCPVQTTKVIGCNAT